MLRLEWKRQCRDEWRARCGLFLVAAWNSADGWRAEVSGYYGGNWTHKKSAHSAIVAQHRAERLLVRVVRREQRRLAKVAQVMGGKRA